MDKLIEEIASLKEAHGATILAHNYVMPEIQDIADFVGDSLELSIKSKQNRAKIIVFCGVRFMAETAKLLCPDAKVLMPRPDAGCPMADTCNADDLKAYREANPDTVIIAYVNTTAATKALVDICCTSGNAERVVASIPRDKKIMFLPDRNLGSYISRRLGRDMEFWDGCCRVHNAISLHAIRQTQAKYPEACTIVHPECREEIIDSADVALSTAGMIKYVANSDKNSFIIGTEIGMLHRLQKLFPNKTFYPLEGSHVFCVNMKKITLESVRDCLRDQTNVIELPPEIMREAVKPIERMLEI